MIGLYWRCYSHYEINNYLCHFKSIGCELVPNIIISSLPVHYNSRRCVLPHAWSPVRQCEWHMSDWWCCQPQWTTHGCPQSKSEVLGRVRRTTIKDKVKANWIRRLERYRRCFRTKVQGLRSMIHQLWKKHKVHIK